MRKKNREVTDHDEILGILGRCDTIRLGIHDEPYPYIVPVSFGMDVVDGQAVLYFHCAKEGMRVDLLAQNPQVCVEADIFYCYEVVEHGITTRYESVIGFGPCTPVEDSREILKGLKLICEHCGYDKVPLNTCEGLPNVKIYKIKLESITGKRNLPQGQ